MEIRPILSALLRSKTGAVLVAAQVALTLAIVANALFVVETRLATASRPTGADEANLFHLLYVGAGEIADREAMRQRDLEVLRAIPGVASAAATNQVPLGRSGWGLGITLDPKDFKSAVGVASYFGDGLVDTLGLALVEGRPFEASEVREIDSRTSDPKADTVILTRHVVETLWPDGPEGGTAVGKTVYLLGPAVPLELRVVGVVDMLMSPFGQTNVDAYKSIILPIQYHTSAAQYAVRTEPGQRDRVLAQAEKELTALRNDRVLVHKRTMDEMREQRYAGERAGATQLIAITVMLLLVTASGIVGVASLWVSQRRKQIGVRRALGARRIDILRYFVTENLMITTVGVVAGVALALGLNQVLVSHLELARLPLGYVIAGVVALWVLGIVAVLGPAWRASTIPPAIATRST